MRGRGRLPPVLLLSVQGVEAAAFSVVRADRQPLSWIVIQGDPSFSFVNVLTLADYVKILT